MVVLLAQPTQFEELPEQQNGGADGDVASSAQERCAERDLGRHTEGGAKQHIGTLLNAGIAWDEKGEGQPGMQQAFDGQGIEKADRRTEQPEGDPAAGALGHPAEEMDGVASGEKVDTCIDLCQLGLDGLEVLAGQIKPATQDRSSEPREKG